MVSVFTKIIEKKISAHIVLENDNYLAFLDVNPLVEGHTLVVPKKEVDYIFDLDDQILSGLLPFSKKVAKAIEKVIPCERIGISVIGLEVPHAHVHLMPINVVSDMDFSQMRRLPSEEELADTAKKIRKTIR